MNYLRCCFIGHRKIKETNELRERLKEIIEDMIINKNIREFLFGSKSEFDSLCHQEVSELKIKYENIKRIKYTCKSEGCYLEGEKNKWKKILSHRLNLKEKIDCYEEEKEFKEKYVSRKASYIERNQEMIDDSEYCVFYYDEEYEPIPKNKTAVYRKQRSGTEIAYFYAKRKGKAIINVF